MKKVMKYPIYPITFSYVIGIFCGFYFSLAFNVVLFFGILATILLLILYFLQRKSVFNIKLNSLTLTFTCIVFISLGFLVFKLNNKPKIIKDLNQQEFTVKVIDVLKSNNYVHRAYGILLTDKNQPKVLVSFSNKDSVGTIGGVYKIIGSVKEISPPRNPYDFNYKQYLQHKHIYYQITSYHNIVKIGEDKSLFISIIKFRDYLIKQFTKLGYSKSTKGFIEALLFGKKNNLDNELQQNFKDFGILHVLAVSGMHVLVLFGTFTYILKRLYIPNNIITIILIIFLLVFTVMAGFSGSVVRASLMCVLAIVGTLTNRPVPTLYMLISSMLLILLIEPNYVFDVGFQLSYLAVFSIVYYYPIVQKYFTFKNYIANYFGQLIGISIIAQLGVLPLTIYYFKQIPLLFLIGNLIAIPLTTVLLAAWFLQMILSLLSVKIFSIFTPILEEISSFCFEVLGNLTSFFSVKAIDFSLDISQTLLLLLIIFCVFWYFNKKQFHKIVIGLLLVIALQTIVVKNTIDDKHRSKIILISDTKNIVILEHIEQKIIQISNLKTTSSFDFKHYMLHNNIKSLKNETLKNIFNLKDKKWLLIDSLGVYPKIKTDYIVLHNNAKVNLERLVKTTHPKIVILHNSNPEYLVKLYVNYLEEQKIPYYDMRSKGSYIVN